MMVNTCWACRTLHVQPVQLGAFVQHSRQQLWTLPLFRPCYCQGLPTFLSVHSSNMTIAKLYTSACGTGNATAWH